MNNRGMSYIEVLIAAALLAIFTVPVLSGFLGAARNQQYALAAYEASLYTANLLTEAGTGDYLTLLESPDFQSEYKTDIYDYCLYVYKREARGLSLEFFGATNPEMKPDAVMPVFDGYALPQSAAHRLTIDFDSDYTGSDTAIVLSGDTDIFISGNNNMDIEFINGSAVPAHVNIYAHDSMQINVNCIDAGAGLTVLFEKPTQLERIAMAETYNKDGRLLNRLVVPIIFEGARP
jgi:type II secretory pathway pseudopilin PulG